MKTITLAIEGMTCGHCVASVRSALATVPAVHVAEVSRGTATLHVADAPADAGTSIDAAIRAVSDAGYPATLASRV